MDAGKLNKVIDIYKETITNDVYGSSSTTYTLVYQSVRANLQDGNLFRQVVNDVIYGAQSRYFTIRDYYNILIGYYVKYKGAMYRISAIKEQQADRALELTTELVSK